MFQLQHELDPRDALAGQRTIQFLEENSGLSGRSFQYMAFQYMGSEYFQLSMSLTETDSFVAFCLQHQVGCKHSM